MKKLTFLMAALLVAMAGCQKEAQITDEIAAGDKVYMEFKIQAISTRSETDNENESDYGSSDANPDVEVGQYYENTITTVDVVLRNADSYICTTVNNPTGADNKTTWVAVFESSQLVASAEYDVYIYANCGAKQELNTISNATIASMTVKDKFWMTNAYNPVHVTLPDDFTQFNSPETAYNVGDFYVERTMARFDYMPNGPYTLQKDGENPTVQITLTEAALINQSKEFYLLRRVSNDGTNTNWTIGGGETKNNYVVDSDYSSKNDGYQDSDAANFDYHMTDATNWAWESIAPEDLTKPDSWEGEDDGKTGLNPIPEHNLNGYYIWQYAKENTIAGDFANQQNGLSTGVVFKGELSGSAIPNPGTEPIYVFDNILYGTWSQVITASSTNQVLQFYVEKFGDSIDEGEYDDLGAAGFTAYKPENNKYYAFYYYWNRHNDNGDNLDMGRMEFAVVRNNVYKLCVDYINKYGHPNPTDPSPVDPDPIAPTDPDEEGETEEYYFSVSVKVVPWVVRVNHIGW